MNENNDRDPYSGMSPPVPVEGGGGVDLAGRTLPASHGVEWIRDAWAMFRQRPFPWIAICLIYVAISVAASLIPVIGVLSLVLTPLLSGGLMFACERARKTGEVDIGDLFAGIRRKAWPLAAVGLLTLAIVLAGLVVMAVPGVGAFRWFFSLFSNVPDAEPVPGSGFLLALLAYMMVVLLAITAGWYAPALIILHDVSPFDAMKASLVGATRNWASCLIYGLVLALLMIVASIPVFLGWLVVIPLTFMSTYSSYRDIFAKPAVIEPLPS